MYHILEPFYDLVSDLKICGKIAMPVPQKSFFGGNKENYILQHLYYLECGLAFSYLFYMELSVLALKKGEPIPNQDIIETIFLQIMNGLEGNQSPDIRASSLAMLHVRKKFFYEPFREGFLSKLSKATQLNEITILSDRHEMHILMMLYDILATNLQKKSPVTSPSELNKSAVSDHGVVDALFALQAKHSPKIRERIVLCQ